MLFVPARRMAAGLFASALAQLAFVGAAQAAGIPDNLVTSLRYEVVGTITPNCSLTQPATSVSVVDLQDQSTDTIRSTKTDLPFTIDCNTPVKVAMLSSNGGLATPASTSDQDFATLVAYRASLDLPGAAGALQCDSAAMAPSGSGCQRELTDPVTQGDGAIRLSTDASGQLLLAGTYHDTVTLTVTPQLSGDDGE